MQTKVGKVHLTRNQIGLMKNVYRRNKNLKQHETILRAIKLMKIDLRSLERELSTTERVRRQNKAIRSEKDSD